jgi:hypothetical protein
LRPDISTLFPPTRATQLTQSPFLCQEELMQMTDRAPIGRRRIRNLAGSFLLAISLIAFSLRRTL